MCRLLVSENLAEMHIYFGNVFFRFYILSIQKTHASIFNQNTKAGTPHRTNHKISRYLLKAHRGGSCKHKLQYYITITTTSTDKKGSVQTNKYRQKRIAWQLHKHPMRNVQNYQYTIVLQKKLQYLHQNLNFLNHVIKYPLVEKCSKHSIHFQRGA